MNDSIPLGDYDDSDSEGGAGSGAAALSDGEVLVCLSCFNPIDPNAHLCIHCGAPVSDRAMFDPFASIWGQGYSYRQITRHGARPNRVGLIGIWLLFGPRVLAFMIFLLITLKAFLEWLAGNSYSIDPSTDGLVYYLWTIAGLSLLLSIYGAILYRVTQNYCQALEIKVLRGLAYVGFKNADMLV